VPRKKVVRKENRTKKVDRVHHHLPDIRSRTAVLGFLLRCILLALRLSTGLPSIMSWICVLYNYFTLFTAIKQLGIPSLRWHHHYSTSGESLSGPPQFSRVAYRDPMRHCESFVP
jgi:hypothetical protein